MHRGREPRHNHLLHRSQANKRTLAVNTIALHCNDGK